MKLSLLPLVIQLLLISLIPPLIGTELLISPSRLGIKSILIAPVVHAYIYIYCIGSGGLISTRYSFKASSSRLRKRIVGLGVRLMVLKESESC